MGALERMARDGKKILLPETFTGNSISQTCCQVLELQRLGNGPCPDGLTGKQMSTKHSGSHGGNSGDAENEESVPQGGD